MSSSEKSPTEKDPILRLVAEHQDACEFLRESHQLSYAIALEREVSKALVLGAASYFEKRITTFIAAMTTHLGDTRVTALVRLKAIKRQYHTYFAWDKRKLGPFKTLFGDIVADALKKLTREHPTFKLDQDAFLEIGQLRNVLVHSNFATHTLDGTTEEWITKYKSASRFVDCVEALLAPLPRTISPGPPKRILRRQKPGDNHRHVKR